MKLSTLFRVRFVALSLLATSILVQPAVAQIVDNAFAAPVGIEVNCNRPDGQLHLEVSTNPAPLEFGQTRTHVSSTIFDTTPSASQRIFPRMRAETIYYIHAALDSAHGVGAPIELVFDLPEGYEMLVQGTPMANIQESISTVRTWKVLLQKVGAKGQPSGDFRGPSLGEDSVFDISLGMLETGAPQGYLRVDRQAFLNGHWDRRLIQTERRFSEVFRISESAVESGPWRQIGSAGNLGSFSELVDVALINGAGGSGVILRFYNSSWNASRLENRIDHDNDPETPPLVDVNHPDVTLVQTWTITCLQVGSKKILNLSRTRGAVTWQGQVEYTPTGRGIWILRQGLMADGQSWLSEIKHVFTTATVNGVSHQVREEVFAAGVEDANLNNIVDTDEAKPFTSIPARRDDFLFVPAYDGGTNVLRLHQRTQAPGSSDERVTSYEYYTDPSKPGSYGKLKKVTHPNGGDVVYTYFDGTTDEELRARGRLKSITRPNPLSSDGETGALDSGAVRRETFTWMRDDEGNFYNYIVHQREVWIEPSGGSASRIAYTERIAGRVGVYDSTVQIANREWIDETGTFRETITESSNPNSNTTWAGRIYRTHNNESMLGTHHQYHYGNYDSSTGIFTPNPEFGSYERTLATTGRYSQVAVGESVSGFSLIDGHSQRTAKIHSISDGLLIGETREIYVNGVWKLVACQEYEYVREGQYQRLVGTRNVITGEATTQTWAEGRLVSESHPDGSTISYQYDAMGRRIRKIHAALAPTDLGSGQTAITHPEQVEETIYDIYGSVIKTRQRSSAAESPELSQSQSFNLVGEVISATPSCGTTTTYARTKSATAGEGWIVTKTLPNGTEEITTHLVDGRVAKIEAAGQATRYFHYAVLPNGHTVETVRMGTDTASAPYVRSEYDWRGQLRSQTTPTLNPSNGVTSRTATFTYDRAGRVLSESSTNAPTIRYAYGLSGVDNFSTRQWTEHVADGTFDANAEPAQESYIRAIWEDGVAWRETTNYIYAKAGSLTRTFAGSQRERLTGLSASLLGEKQLIDGDGHVTTTTLTADGVQRIETVTQQTNQYDTISVQRRSIAGRLYREEDPFGRVQTHVYDALGRRIEAVDFEGRVHETRLASNCGKVLMELPNNAEARIGYSYYDESSAPVGSRGQLQYRFVLGPGHPDFLAETVNPAALVLADERVRSVERFVYDSAGRLTEVWSGDQKRSTTSYDSLGRQIELKVHRDNGTAASRVQWVYDANTGQLRQRKDSKPGDPTTLVSEFYRYNINGTLNHKIDARGITASFSYGSSADGYAYGRLRQISFSDGVTPTVTHTYHRSGQAASVNNGVTGLTTYAYDDDGAEASLRLLSAGLDSSFYGNAVTGFEATYEASDSATTLKGRANGFAYLSGANTVVGMTRTHDAYGRATQLVTRSGWSGPGIDGTAFTLGHDSTSQRLTTVAAPLLATGEGHFAQTFDWNSQGRLLSVASGHDANADGVLDPSAGGNDFVNAHYSYSYDAFGRKEWEVSQGHLFARYPGGGLSTRYRYDPAGFLASAVTHTGVGMTEAAPLLLGRDYGFTYDQAGNRLSRSVDGVAYNYAVDDAHTYNSRQNPTTASYSGMAGPDLTVNGTVPQTRAGDYFLHRAPVANQSGPVWASATLASGSQGVDTGTVVPAQTEGFGYDNVGNLTADGQWSYTYDALNRLIAMEGFAHPSVPGQSVIDGLPVERDVRLEFRYDEQNRRVEKTVRDRFSGTVKKRERFLYQGWNLVATLDATDLNNIQVVSQYFWRTGSADTGSFGLLMIAGDHDGDPGTTRRAYYTGYDGRGNLTSLAAQTRGVAAAAFEYSPFGERLRAEGTGQLPDLDALGVHFGFATQYTDRETGLVYFGHRYYHPGLGRFLNRDPLGEAGGLNRYLYASNDPINFTDYRGLCDADPGESGFWGSLFGSIGGFVSGVIEGAFGVVGAAVHGVSTIVDGIGYALDFIGLDFIGDVFHAAADIGHAIGGAITSFGGALGSFVGSGIDMAIGGVESAIRGIRGAIGGAFGGLFPWSVEPPQQVDCDQLRADLTAAQNARGAYGGDPAPGWKASGDPITDPSGFSATMFKGPNGEHMLAIAGTSLTDWGDIVSNYDQAFGNIGDQYRYANSLESTFSGLDFSVAGHSLGGGLASVFGASTGRTTTTFNAAGIHSETMAYFGVSSSDASNYVRAVSVQGDILTGSSLLRLCQAQ